MLNNLLTDEEETQNNRAVLQADVENIIDWIYDQQVSFKENLNKKKLRIKERAEISGTHNEKRGTGKLNTHRTYNETEGNREIPMSLCN